ncbi:MAG TPA: ABC transporter substrate-binding protein [Nevskiaceae bacterium]|nr:ABC transporter substrate-binding protein [Nevskiaceae bacterium]
MKRRTPILSTALASLACAAAIAYAAPSLAAGSVNVGLSSSLTGPAAALGIASKNAYELGIDEINAHGGLLGKQIKLLTADGQLKPNTGVTNIRNFILADQAKAIFTPVSSAVAIAEAGIAAQYKVPIFFAVSNDIELTGKKFSNYAFQVVPNTYMEPHAMALYVASLFKKNHWKTLYTIAPNYAFGHSTVDQFLAGLKADGVHVKVVGQQWPQVGASDFTQYISAIMATKPDFVFAAEYGGDLITLTKQGQSAGLFQSTHFLGDYWPLALKALGKDAPAGAITDDRAPPFYTIHTKAMEQFANAYHARFHTWPGTWAILSYSSLQTWVDGVKKAGSFDGTKVADALSGGVTVDTVRGSFKLRACDHMAEIPVYLGTLSKDINPTYGRRVMSNVVVEPAQKIMMDCNTKVAMRHS